MQRERFMLKFPEKKHWYFLIICAAAVFCSYRSAEAQSGRRPNKDAASTVQPPAAIEPATNRQTTGQTDRISSIAIVGEVQHDFAVFRSTYLGSALAECVDELKARPQKQPVLNVVKGGKLNFTEAQERAKKETDTYVLWIGFVIRDGGLGNELVDYIDYAVLTPQTGKRLTYGRISPGQAGVVAQGGVLSLPPRSRRSSAITVLRAGAREIADTLMRGGWL